MAALGNPQGTIELIKKYNFNIKKQFGQNFLIDDHVLTKIIKAADITKEDFVLEIGPGIGALTQCLCEAAKKVVAVEIDNKLIPILHDSLASYRNVTIIEGDILKMDLSSFSKEYCDGKPFKIVANLPYYITTPIIMNVLEHNLPFISMTVMVQKEVAERMRVGPGTKDYGALSLAVQYYAKPYLAANVPPNCFIPRPGVGSAVICLTKHVHQPVNVEDEELMFRCIRAAFNQRRKMLVNALHNSSEINYTKEQIAEALIKVNLPDTVRGEALTLEQFAQLSNWLTHNNYD